MYFFFFEIEKGELNRKLTAFVQHFFCEYAMGRCAGMKGAMVCSCNDLLHFFMQLHGVLIKGKSSEFFPNVIYGGFIGMHKVLFEKAVIAQVIGHQFVSREIKNIFGVNEGVYEFYKYRFA